jgi:penicillin-binding protein 1C
MPLDHRHINKHTHNSRKKLIVIAVAATGTGVIMGLAALVFYLQILRDLPSPQKLEDFQSTALSSHIYDRNGILLYKIYRDENRTYVRLDELPKHVYQASISIEDKDFYSHGGVSIVSGILRAIKDTYINRRGLQGGSTITQQLVKKTLLSDERTITRKMKELILAIEVERRFDKNKILEMYMNQIPYGGSAYGIEEASNMYFGTSAAFLDASQSALLAGLPQAPSRYSPYANPDLAVARRNEVLKQMFEQKYIDKATYDKARKSELVVRPLKHEIKAPHFVFYVRNILEQEFGKEVVERGGLEVHTTLDYHIQQEAEKIVKEELDKVKRLNVGNGAALVTRPVTGEILAMVGSSDYFASPSGTFNVTTALRQPGSAIKPINYAIALDRKLITPASVLIDAHTCFPSPGKPYCPKNYQGGFSGPMQIRFALGNSNNVIAVKTLALNTVDHFIASSSAFLISSFSKDPSRYGLSLTLGGGEVTMIEMAQAFSVLSNRGKPKRLRSILKVMSPQNKVLYEFKDPNFVASVGAQLKMPNYVAMPDKQAISEEAAFLVSHILLDNNARAGAFGTNSLLRIPRHEAVSVKTGTTNDLRDNWTIGYTPNFLVAVWVGNNDNSPMNQFLTSGVTGAAPIWNRIMTHVLKDQPDLWPVKPEGIIGKTVCFDGRLRDGDGGDCGGQEGRFEYFINGTENIRTAFVEKQFIWVGPDDKQTKEGVEGAQLVEKDVIRDQWSTWCITCTQ